MVHPRLGSADTGCTYLHLSAQDLSEERTPRHPVEKALSLVPSSPSRFVEPVAGGRRQTRPGNYLPIDPAAGADPEPSLYSRAMVALGKPQVITRSSSDVPCA